MRRFAAILTLLILLPLQAGAEPGKQAPRAQPGAKYLRVVRDKEGAPQRLETSIVRFQTPEKKGVTVDLIGAVHVGDATYYERLNKTFADYDVVLYELVAPEGTRIPRGGRGPDNPLAALQRAFTESLNLTAQTDAVDYTVQNFVHADLSPEGIAETLAKRGDNAMTITLSLTADLIRESNLARRRAAETEAEGSEEDAEEDADEADQAGWQPPAVAPWELLTDPTAPRRMKLMLADQFDDTFERPAGGLGKTLEQILIADRNSAAMRVLDAQIKQGKTRIAIFYGAAHMPDFEKRLAVEHGLRPGKPRWITAWDLTADE